MVKQGWGIADKLHDISPRKKLPELLYLGRQACLDVIAQQIRGGTDDLDYVGT